MEIVTIPVILIDQFYFYMDQPIKAWLFEVIIFEIILRYHTQVITLKKMMVLSAKFTILISWSPIWIRLILLSELIKLASTSAAIMYNSIDSTHIRVKGSDRSRFILILDSIMACVNKFVSISKLMQSRKDKINSKNITEKFLFSLFDSLVM